MDAICGILGKRDSTAVRAMANAMKHRGDARHLTEGDTFSVASSTPPEGALCLVDGMPRDLTGAPLSVKDLHHRCNTTPQGARWFTPWR